MNWFTKLIFKISPRLGMKFLASKMDIDSESAKEGHEFFDEANRIDIIPSKSGYRGFALVVDREAAFYFRQKGEKFVYSGYEIGDFHGGDVTVFDDLRQGN